MRLVDISEFFSDFGGGVRTYVHQKLEAAAHRGVETTIIAPGPCDRREKRLGGEIIWVRSPVLAFDHRYHLFADMRPVHALLDEIAPDFIEGSSTWRGAWMAAKWRGAAARSLFLHQDPVAVYPQSLLCPALGVDAVDAAFGWFWAYMRRLARNFDIVVAPSQSFGRRLERFGVALKPLVIPLGVDKRSFSHERRSATLRAEMLAECGVSDPSAKLVLAVGRHHIEKRLPMLIEGFNKFAGRRPAGLYIIGDGPMRRAISRAAGRSPGVCVAGAESDRARLAARLASADFLIHGGAAETFGLVVAEALCSGLPIVTPDIGAACDLAHPAYGESYAFGDAGSLADAMERITLRDNDQLALAARAGGHRLSSPADHFDALFAAYRSLAGASGADMRAA